MATGDRVLLSMSWVRHSATITHGLINCYDALYHGYFGSYLSVPEEVVRKAQITIKVINVILMELSVTLGRVTVCLGSRRRW